MNAGLLLATTTSDFIFDDPAESTPVTRDGLEAYMHRWDQRTRAQGATNEWVLSLESRQDNDGILTDWEWWELVGSDLSGSAVVQTCDAGVMFERITYFDRNARSTASK